MDTKVAHMGVKSLIWFTNKTMRKAFSGMFIHNGGMLRAKQLLGEGKKVVLMPVYKSFLDAFVLTYVLNHYKMD